MIFNNLFRHILFFLWHSYSTYKQVLLVALQKYILKLSPIHLHGYHPQSSHRHHLSG